MRSTSNLKQQDSRGSSSTCTNEYMPAVQLVSVRSSLIIDPRKYGMSKSKEKPA